MFCVLENTYLNTFIKTKLIKQMSIKKIFSSMFVFKSGLLILTHFGLVSTLSILPIVIKSLIIEFDGIVYYFSKALNSLIYSTDFYILL